MSIKLRDLIDESSAASIVVWNTAASTAAKLPPFANSSNERFPDCQPWIGRQLVDARPISGLKWNAAAKTSSTPSIERLEYPTVSRQSADS